MEIKLSDLEEDLDNYKHDQLWKQLEFPEISYQDKLKILSIASNAVCKKYDLLSFKEKPVISSNTFKVFKSRDYLLANSDNYSEEQILDETLHYELYHLALLFGKANFYEWMLAKSGTIGVDMDRFITYKMYGLLKEKIMSKNLLEIIMQLRSEISDEAIQDKGELS